MSTNKSHRRQNRVSSVQRSVINEFAENKREDEFTRPVVCTLTGTFTTSGAGTLTGVITMNPSSAADWALVSTYYDEFRVVGVKITLVSDQQYSVTSKNALGIMLFDNDNAATQSFTQAQQYANKVFIPAVFSHVNGANKVKTYFRPNTMKAPIPWVDTQSPANSLGSLQLIWAPAALSVSTTYFDYAVQYMIEARGRR